jgi:hypothetical protein
MWFKDIQTYLVSPPSCVCNPAPLLRSSRGRIKTRRHTRRYSRYLFKFKSNFQNSDSDSDVETYMVDMRLDSNEQIEDLKIWMPEVGSRHAGTREDTPDTCIQIQIQIQNQIQRHMIHIWDLIRMKRLKIWNFECQRSDQDTQAHAEILQIPVFKFKFEQLS